MKGTRETVVEIGVLSCVIKSGWCKKGDSVEENRATAKGKERYRTCGLKEEVKASNRSMSILKEGYRQATLARQKKRRCEREGLKSVNRSQGGEGRQIYIETRRVGMG